MEVANGPQKKVIESTTTSHIYEINELSMYIIKKGMCI